MKFVPFLLVLAACAGCPSPPPPPPATFDGGIPSDEESTNACGGACANQRKLACSDVAAECEDVCRHVVATHLTPIDPLCAAKAGSKEELRACVGPWRCP